MNDIAGPISFDAPPSEMPPSDPFFSSASFAGSQILQAISISRDCVEQESNYIALMEFDHDVTEAIERLNGLRLLAMDRVSYIQNLSLLEVA